MQVDNNGHAAIWSARLLQLKDLSGKQNVRGKARQ
jgi:hypothetical protein